MSGAVVVLAVAILVGPALAVLAWQLTTRDARIMRARRREARRRARSARLWRSL